MYEQRWLVLGAFAKLRRAALSFFMSFFLSIRPVRLSARNNSAPTGPIFVKLDIRGFRENLFWKFKFIYNLTRITATLHEDLSTFTISRSVLLRMRNVWDRCCKKIHILCWTTFPENRDVWVNVEKYCRAGQAFGDNMVHPNCMLDKYGYKHTLRICNTSFPWKQWLRERASVLCYTCIACLVLNSGDRTTYLNTEQWICSEILDLQSI